MIDFVDFKTTYELCKELNFRDDLTAEMCWNEAYRLGRARWHWGPGWLVTLTGRLNTLIARAKNFFHGGSPG